MFQPVSEHGLGWMLEHKPPLDYDSLAEPSAAFPPERSIMLALEVFERVICATAAKKGSMFCRTVSAAQTQDI